LLSNGDNKNLIAGLLPNGAALEASFSEIKA